ncbi:MAG: LacI family DNA-binding transcriptional regulator [Rhodospirillaceae bacterium]|nr:LacI family DNA-binding transcriptional regulator [Rhodospirillaceae bacterium]
MTAALRTVSLEDVAKEAGVSIMTVSRAFRRPEALSEDTLSRVLQAADALGYVPNQIASGLRSRRSQTIACVIPTISSSVYANVVQGLSDAITADGYSLVLGTSNYGVDEERRVMTSLLGYRPEAVVLAGGDHRPELTRLVTRLKAPLVEIWELVPKPLDMNVGFSNHAAGAAIVEHLIRMGSRRIALMTIRAEHARARARRIAYEAAAARLGHEPIVVTSELSIEGGRRGMAMLRARHPDVDGVFCVSDSIALGAMLKANEIGWSVPDEIAIAGFGDFDIARHIPPGLTTVRVPEARVGQVAGEMIMSRLLRRPEGPYTVDVGFEVVARGSTNRNPMKRVRR